MACRQGLGVRTVLASGRTVATTCPPTALAMTEAAYVEPERRRSL
jgi:hypothetical protein